MSTLPTMHSSPVLLRRCHVRRSPCQEAGRGDMPCFTSAALTPAESGMSL